MKTISATQAREKLGHWLQRAAKGEDIGIIYPSSGQIIALRPVEVYSADFTAPEKPKKEPACFKYLSEISTPAEAMKNPKAFIKKKIMEKNK